MPVHIPAQCRDARQYARELAPLLSDYYSAFLESRAELCETSARSFYQSWTADVAEMSSRSQ